MHRPLKYLQPSVAAPANMNGNARPLAREYFAVLLLLLVSSAGPPLPLSPVIAARAVHVGIVASLEGVIGEGSKWIIDGYLVGIEEYNREEALGAANLTSSSDLFQHHPPINVSILNTKDQTAALFLPTLTDPLMGNNATRLDAIGVSLGLENTIQTLNFSDVYQVPVFSPLTGDRTMFLQNRGALSALIIPLADAEMAALVKEVVVRRQLRRIAIMTMLGQTTGNELIPYLRTLLSELGLEIVYHLQIANSVAPFEQPAIPLTQQLVQLSQSDPQVLFMFAAFFAETAVAIAQTAASLNFNVLITCTAASSVILEGVMAALPQGILANKVITTMYFPLHTDTATYAVARAYRRAFTRYGTIVNASSTLAQQDSTKTLVGNYGVSGYVVARLFCEVVKAHYGAPVTAASIAKIAFSRQTFMINDVALGPYSLGCEGALAGTALCGGPCHSGSRAVFLATFDAQRKLVAIDGARHELPAGVCIPFGDIVRSPLVQLVARPDPSAAWATATAAAAEEVEAATVAAAQFSMGDAAGYVNATTTPSTRQATYSTLNLTIQGTAELEAKHRDRVITLASGSILSAPLKDKAVYANLTVLLDPLHVGGAPRLHRKTFSPRTVYLLASLDQEIHALARTFGPRGIDVMWSTSASSSGGSGGSSDAKDAAEDVAKAVRASLHTFGHDTMGSVIEVASIADGLTARAASMTIAGARPLLVLGVRSAADVEAVTSFAAAGGELLLPFSTLRLWYRKLLAAVANKPDAARQRLYFATALPNWRVSSSAANHTSNLSSTLLREYRDGLGAAESSPQSLLGFLTQRFVANIAERIPSKLTDASFLRTIYAVSVVVLETGVFTVGPFSEVSCSGGAGKTADASAAATLCESNVGARTVEVRSLASVAPGAANSESEAALSTMTFQSSRVTYQNLPAAVGTNPLIVAFAVVGAVLLLGTIIAIIATRLLSGRNNRNAPKDASQPFTIVFTDIQSSTSLWAEVPDVMAPALAAHHALIRRLIAEHNGYEVKTIGDAFMIAFKRADDAVRLSHALQLKFMRCPEFSETIDAAYLSFEQEQTTATTEQTAKTSEAAAWSSCDDKNTNDTGNNNKMMSGGLSPEAYHRLWHGLRVRIGIHTAFGEIQQDATSGGYDYYGTVVNTAARIEAAGHGGQVLLSERTLAALCDITLDVVTHDRSATDDIVPQVVRAMGAVELRGLTDPVHLYELETVPGRVFPPLRVENSAAIGDADTGGDVSLTPEEDRAATGHSNDSETRTPSDVESLPSACAADSTHHHPPEVQAMGVLAALVACMPPKARRTELRRLADAWRLQVTDRDDDHADDRRGKAGAATLRASAAAMSRGDTNIAASLQALSAHLTPIAARIVSSGSRAPRHVARSRSIVSAITPKATKDAENGGGHQTPVHSYLTEGNSDGAHILPHSTVA